MKINPSAFLLWPLASGIGALVSDDMLRGALKGFVIMLGISVVITVIEVIVEALK